MATFLTILWNYLWAAPPIIQLVILRVMVRRQLSRQFPWFFAYTAYAICKFAVLFPMYHLESIVSGWLYVHTYLCFMAGGAIINFGVVFEIFVHISRSYVWLNKFGKALLCVTALALIIFTVIFAVFTHPNHIDDSLIYGVYLLDRSNVFLKCGLLISLFAFSKIMNLSWPKPLFGIALGATIVVSVELIISAISTQVGHIKAFDFITMGTYHVCVLIWLFYFLRSEKPTPDSMQAVPATADLEAWNSELQRLLQHQ